jgi:hypothetical protein
MFRCMSGYKANYHYLSLMVIAEFNEWRVVVFSPDGVVLGTRQFGEVKAKEHALIVARQFVHDYKQQDLPVLPEVQWVPTAHDDCLVYS